MKKKRFFMIKELGAIIGTVVFLIFFSIMNRNFLTVENLMSTLTMASELGIMAVGITLLMISGEFDLSVGSVFAIVPMISAISINSNMNPILAVSLSLLVAIGIGIMNGVITIFTGIPSFITTLGTMMFWRGIILAVTGGFSIMLEKKVGFLNLFGGLIVGEIRFSTVWFMLFAILFGIILERTRFGNWCFATGGNLGASIALGIPVKSVKMTNFIVSSLLAGISGITTFARFKVVDPTFGQGMELEAIASAVIGGTLLSGGYGSILGTFIGAFMIGMVQSGLVLIGAPAYWYRAFVGVILVIAAIINSWIRKRVAG
ncbi:MAG: ABC transporter permease [Thermotoga sp.]|nr:MAG: ABC transporter permease [Thermotoga sp.]